MEKKYLEKLLELADQAYEKEEAPISAIIVYKNEIIAEAYNERNSSNSTISHAEIKTIEIANQKLKSWRLNNCTMYVTMKPCEMCEKVIKEARIDKVFYLVEREENKKQYNKTEFIKNESLRDDKLIKNYKNLLTNFWKNKR